LPYWDPTQCIVVDGMHNLFLGLTQFHIRHVLGIDASGKFENKHENNDIDKDKLVKARQVLISNPTFAKLKQYSIAILKALCIENQVNLPIPKDMKSIRKVDFIMALLVCSFNKYLYIYF
jgi:hypothetical protein